MHSQTEKLTNITDQIKMRIGFAFTGAGHLLRESVQLAEKLAKEHEVTVFL